LHLSREYESVKSDEVNTIVAAAWKAVEAAGIPESTQAVAFEAAIRLLVGEQRSNRRVDIGDSERDDAGVGHLELDASGSVAKIAKKLEADAQDVARIYRFDEDDRLTVDIGLSKLPKTTAAAARDLVLLVAAGRQSALPENETETTLLVPTLEEHKVYDSKNFKSKHLKREKDNWKVTRDGDAVRVSPDGMRVAATLISKYAHVGE
jgi:hypothetical protein